MNDDPTVLNREKCQAFDPRSHDGTLRDPDDIRLEPSPGHGEPNECRMCSLIADDQLETLTRLWHVCSHCADLLPAIMLSIADYVHGDCGNLEYLQYKLDQYKERKRLGV